MKSAFLFLLIILIAQSVTLAQSQCGSITGKVFNSTTQEPIVGATVVVAGTTIGNEADSNGNF